MSYTKIPLNQPHAQFSDTDEVQEFSRVITSTDTMPTPAWKRSALFATAVSCLHHLGLMQLPALYLYFERGVRYVDFYEALLSFLLEDPDGVFSVLRQKLDDLVERHAAAVAFDDHFGNVAWGFEEYAFLCTVYEKEAFYRRMDAFLRRYIPEDAFRRELIGYQSFIIKTARDEPAVFTASYAWKPYLASLILDEPRPLQKRAVRYTIEEPYRCPDWATYAREIVWYGRRGGKFLYSSELVEAYPDA